MAGLRCPSCHSEQSHTVNSRAVEFWRWRRRSCACGHTWTTVELPYTGRLKEVLWVKVKVMRAESSTFDCHASS